jgi:hypothetical protein
MNVGHVVVLGSERQTAIDHELVARDEVGVIRGKQESAAGDIDRLA